MKDVRTCSKLGMFEQNEGVACFPKGRRFIHERLAFETETVLEGNE